jgi:hypothetical protein
VTYKKNFRLPFFNLECKGKGIKCNGKRMDKVFLKALPAGQIKTAPLKGCKSMIAQ